MKHKGIPITPEWLKTWGFSQVPRFDNWNDFQLFVDVWDEVYGQPFPSISYRHDIQPIHCKNDLIFVEIKFDRKQFCVFMNIDDEINEVYVQDDIACGFHEIPTQIGE